MNSDSSWWSSEMGNTMKRVVQGHSLRQSMNNEKCFTFFTNFTHTESHGWVLWLFQELLCIHSSSHRLEVG